MFLFTIAFSIIILSFGPAKVGSKTVELQNGNLKIVTIIKEPYIYYNNATGEFTGFIVDLMKILSLQLRTNSITISDYQFYTTTDQKYGRYDNGSWNGMVKELLDGNADLAFADFTINYERSKVIDFVPFFQSGLSLLVTDTGPNTDPWDFTKPFKEHLWAVLLVTPVVIATILWITDRLSPYGYNESKFDDEDIYRFNYGGSIFSSLMIFVGSSGEPGHSWASRIVIFGYMTFTLIILSFYSSNLSAALTVSRATSNVHGLEDLRVLGNNFGVVSSTSTEAFFLRSNMGTYKRQMISYQTPQLLLAALDKGEISASVSDAPSQDYFTNQPPCKRFLVGKKFFDSNFGIGISKGNRNVTRELALSILELKPNISLLYDKWWSSNTCGKPVDAPGGHLDVYKLSGVFTILGIGCLLALLSLIFDNTFQWWDKEKNYRHVHKFLGYTAIEYKEKKLEIDPSAQFKPRSSRIRQRTPRQNSEEPSDNNYVEMSSVPTIIFNDGDDEER